MKYKVEITEYLQRIVEVDADNKRDALEKVDSMYDNAEIVLSADDFTGKDINVIEE